VPEGELIYAVGDIHGRSDLLAELLLKIEADAAMRLAAKKRLIFLGDYVDRGPDSRGVVEILLHGLPSDFSAHFLKGNHEALLLGFLADASRLDQWRYNGGAFASALPATHLHFLQGLDLLIPADDYLFVHAGVRPGVPLEAQSETDLIWIRDEFLGSTKSFGKVVVHGHTPALEPVMRPNRIGIDTGAVFSGRLTALRLQDGERSFLET
jgi:serine/threonine protein phosphatase 1